MNGYVFVNQLIKESCCLMGDPRKNLPSAREVKSHIDPSAHKKSYFKALGLLSVVFAFYLASFLGTVSPWIWVQILSVAANGLAIGMLFVIGHDASHGTYSPSRKLDRWIARFAFLPSLMPNECWKVVHNYYHHGFTSLKGKDTTWQPLSFEEYGQLSSFQKFLYRHYRTLLGVASYWFVEVWIRYVVRPSKETRYFLSKNLSASIFEYLLLCFYVCALLVVAIALRYRIMGSESIGLSNLLILVPTFVLPTWFFMLQAGLVVLVQHTHPKTHWFATKSEWSYYGANIQNTVHFHFPFPINKLYLDVMEHNAHHVDVQIPIYNLAPQQERLSQEFAGEIVNEYFSFRTLRCILRTCQLYDYERHCWLSFDGVPTTEPLCFQRSPEVRVS